MIGARFKESRRGHLVETGDMYLGASWNVEVLKRFWIVIKRSSLDLVSDLSDGPKKSRAC